MAGKLVITIDGPAGSGKSTAARRLAQRLGVSFLDTGAMYRAVTLMAIRAGVELADERQVLGVMEGSEFGFEAWEGGMRVSIDGEDVTEDIRAAKVTANARYVAGSGLLRGRLVQMQREFAKRQGRIVTEGRDQGTVAFADADVKFFLTASLAERAKRRHKELAGKGAAELEEVARDIAARDDSDEQREIGPLRAADDAIVVDTTDMGIEEVVERLAEEVEKNV